MTEIASRPPVCLDPPRNYDAVLAVGINVFAWASAFPLIHVALQGFGPLPLAATRFSIVAGLALAWIGIARPKLPSGRDSLIFLLCGLVGIAAYNAFLNTGQRTVSAGAASFLVNTGPIITAILATLFLGERFGRIAWLGSIVAFAGVATIAAGQPGGLHVGAGASLVLAAALAQASYFIIQRPLVPRYGAIACTAYTIVAGALLLSPWLPAGLSTLGRLGFGHPSALAVMALAIVPSAVGYVAWTYSLGFFGAARAANFLYLVPPAAMLFAFALTRELPALTTVVGGAVAIAGVAIVNLRSKLGSASRSRPVSDEKAALDRALERASGTWGGYQAAPPFTYRRPD